MAQLPSAVLQDPGSALTAAFVPSAGMVCTSLRDDGVELLGQRRGLQAYLDNGKTMGIPILYPWANRLSANSYPVDGGMVTLTPGQGGVRTDEHGLPMHGVRGLPGLAGHRAVRHPAERGPRLRRSARAAGELPVPAHPHRGRHAEQPHSDGGDHGDGDHRGIGAAVLRLSSLPDHSGRAARAVDTRDAAVASPAGGRPGYPDRGRRGVAGHVRAIGRQNFRRRFDHLPPGAVFALSGADRRIDMVFEQGYPAAQIFAPATEDVVAVEPMAAPTNALRTGGYRTAVPGRPAVSTFGIRVG